MNKKSVISIVVAICFSSFIGGAISASVGSAKSSDIKQDFSYPFVFLKNLKLGDNNQDVRQLQSLLNKDTDTIVATSGSGSQGHEGTYFGQLTAGAVMRFQQKYRKEVLEPYGLYTPTGFVGEATRKKLNQIVADAHSSATSGNVSTTSNKINQSSNSNTSVTVKPNDNSLVKPASNSLKSNKLPFPLVFSTKPFQIRRGDKFTIIGKGFQTKNTLHIGSEVFNDVAADDDSNISFTIPASSNIGNGSFKISVENTLGSSADFNKLAKIIITDNPQQPPVIISTSPSVASASDTITITGTGFTSKGNNVSSIFGKLKNISSNGTQLVFSLKDLLDSKTTSKISAGTYVEINLTVVNANGFSATPAKLKLKL